METEFFFKKKRKIFGLIKMNINSIKSTVFRNKYSLYLRNLFNIKPVDTYRPLYDEACVSDFFYWSSNKNFDTKFMLTNISSHILPKTPQNDNVIFIIYNESGNILKKFKIVLSPYETKEIVFSKLNIKGYGSFFVFHKFSKINNLSSHGSFVAERGYVGYKKNNGIWNFMHGNYNACYLNKKNKIKSIISKSFFTQFYCPQVTFNDTKNFKIIINNPTNSKIKINIECFDKLKKIVVSKSNYIKIFNTFIFEFNNKDVDFIIIKSKILFCRPLILKEYKTNFDIFHG